jgi:hypothetical protein
MKPKLNYIYIYIYIQLLPQRKHYTVLGEIIAVYFENNAIRIKVCAWLRRLVASISPRRPRFAPGSFHVEFVVGKVALG